MANYKMKPGSKQKNTPGGFNQKQTDTIGKLGGQKLGKVEFKTPPKKLSPKPSYTDSLAVDMRNKYPGSAYTPIANAAEKHYGKIDVSNFKARSGALRAREGFEKYGLLKKKK
jgi:hypothetical protein